MEDLVYCKPAGPDAPWPVVIAAPHGGNLAPATIPDRTSGCAEPDWESWPLAEAVWAGFAARAGGEAPALVGLKLSRTKMDANRARAHCCEPDAVEALLAWDSYHGFLEKALQSAVARHGFVLLLDVHGQSHRAGVSELGYLLTSDDLLLANRAIDDEPPRPSSVDAFINGGGGGNLESPGAASARSLAALVRGEHSLGGLLEARGFPCVPSPRQPQPVSAEALAAAKQSGGDIHAKLGPPPEAVAAATYFWGAYTIRRYGAAATIPPANPLADGGSGAAAAVDEPRRPNYNRLPDGAIQGWARHVAAVQLETSWDGVRDTDESRRAFGAALAAATVGMLEQFTHWRESSRDVATDSGAPNELVVAATVPE